MDQPPSPTQRQVDEAPSGATGTVNVGALVPAAVETGFGSLAGSAPDFAHSPSRVVGYVTGSGPASGASSGSGSGDDRDPTHGTESSSMKTDDLVTEEAGRYLAYKAPSNASSGDSSLTEQRQAAELLLHVSEVTEGFQDNDNEQDLVEEPSKSTEGIEDANKSDAPIKDAYKSDAPTNDDEDSPKTPALKKDTTEALELKIKESYDEGAEVDYGEDSPRSTFGEYETKTTVEAVSMEVSQDVVVKGPETEAVELKEEYTSPSDKEMVEGLQQVEASLAKAQEATSPLPEGPEEVPEAKGQEEETVQAVEGQPEVQAKDSQEVVQDEGSAGIAETEKYVESTSSKSHDITISSSDEEKRKKVPVVDPEALKGWDATGVWADQVMTNLRDEEVSKIDVATTTTFLNYPAYTVINYLSTQLTISQLRFFREREWLDDSCIAQTLRLIQNDSSRTFEVIDSTVLSLHEDSKSRIIKKILIGAVKVGLCICVINLCNQHWCVVVLDFTKKIMMLFDPLQSTPNYDLMKRLCDKQFKPHIWDAYLTLRVRWFRDFVQQDGHNCGLYSLEFIRHYLNNTLAKFRPLKGTGREDRRAQFLRLDFLSDIFQHSVLINPDDQGMVVKTEPETEASKTEETTEASKTEEAPKFKRKRGSRTKKKKSVTTLDSPESEVEPVPKRKNKVEETPSPDTSPVKPAPPASASPSTAPVTTTPPPPAPVKTPIEEATPSPQGIPTPKTVTPLPAVKGKKMSALSLVTEMKQFLNKYWRDGVTLPFILGYFRNHIDSSNRQAFMDGLKDNTDEVDGRYRLIMHPGDDLPSPLDEEGGFYFRSGRPGDKKSRSGRPEDKMSPATSPRKRKNASQDTGLDASITKQLSSSEDSWGAWGDSDRGGAPTSSGTESDVQYKVRNQLQTDLKTFLTSKPKGTSNTEIHKYIKPRLPVGTKLSEIHRVLNQVGFEKNRKWYAKDTDKKVSRRLRSPSPDKSTKRSKLSLPTTKPTSSSAESSKGSKKRSRSPSPAKSTKSTDSKTSKAVTSAKPTTTTKDAGESSSASSSKWESDASKRKRLKKQSIIDQEWKDLHADEGVVESIINFRVKNGVREYYVVWEVNPKGTRDKPSWIPVQSFRSISAWKDQIDLVHRWKESKLTRDQFFRQDPQARAFLDLRKNIAADGDGWCAFRAVGVAFFYLTKRTLVSTEMITAFQAKGVELVKGREEAKCGTRWPEVLAFIRQLCSKKVGYGIKVDFEELGRNRYCLGGTGLEALSRCNLEPGVYLMAGFNRDRTAGHCVVLEVVEDYVWVHEEDASGGVENLDWLHQLTYVRRVKLLNPEIAVKNPLKSFRSKL